MTIKWDGGGGGSGGPRESFGNRSNAFGITSSDLNSLPCLVKAK